MQNLVFTQLSVPEVRQLFREELADFFSINQFHQQSHNKESLDEYGGIDLAVQLTGLAKPTIYYKVHKREIPHSKRGNRLRFSRRELIEWIEDGKRLTLEERTDKYLND